MLSYAKLTKNFADMGNIQHFKQIKNWPKPKEIEQWETYIKRIQKLIEGFDE